MMDETLSMGDAEGGTQNELEVRFLEGRLSIAITNPWVGENADGNRFVTEFDLNDAQARTIAKFLLTCLEAGESAKEAAPFLAP
jgi:hypothetical protein